KRGCNTVAGIRRVSRTSTRTSIPNNGAVGLAGLAGAAIERCHGRPPAACRSASPTAWLEEDAVAPRQIGERCGERVPEVDPAVLFEMNQRRIVVERADRCELDVVEGHVAPRLARQPVGRAERRGAQPALEVAVSSILADLAVTVARADHEMDAQILEEIL